MGKAARALSDAQKSAVLYRLIANRWPEERGAYTTLYEVKASTGTGGDEGRLDALIGANWRADGGRRLIGIEVKASRADWLRELRSHTKRRTAEAVCSELWIVAWGGVVQPGELPADWGLLERRGGTLATVRAAVPRKVEAVPLTFALAALRHAAFRRADVPPWAGVHLVRYAGEELDLESFGALVREAAAAEVRIHRDTAERHKLEADKGYKALQLLRRVRSALGLSDPWSVAVTAESERELLDALKVATRGGASAADLKQLEHAERLLRQVRERLTPDQGEPLDEAQAQR